MTDKVISKVHMTGHMPGSMGIIDVQDYNLSFTVVDDGEEDHSEHVH